jgi:hypothetical protein
MPGKRCERESRRERPDYIGKSVLCQPHDPRTVHRGGAAQQQQQPHPPTVAQACAETVGEMSAPPLLRHNQQVPSQSVQAPNANSSSLNDIFKVVATVFQQILTELKI